MGLIERKIDLVTDELVLRAKDISAAAEELGISADDAILRKVSSILSRLNADPNQCELFTNKELDFDG